MLFDERKSNLHLGSCGSGPSWRVHGRRTIAVSFPFLLHVSPSFLHVFTPTTSPIGEPHQSHRLDCCTPWPMLQSWHSRFARMEVCRCTHGVIPCSMLQQGSRPFWRRNRS